MVAFDFPRRRRLARRLGEEEVMAAAVATTETSFDFSARVDALRCHSTGALRTVVAEARREQQRWRLEELAATRVLDDRDALGPMPDASISTRTARAQVEVARALESRPAIAAAAYEGALTWDQLQPLVEVSTPETDKEWAARGPTFAPNDLERMARKTREVTAAEAEARVQARFLRTWRDERRGMVGLRGWLPDVDGVLVEKVLEHMAERMKPVKGATWDSLAHRKADALVELATKFADTQPAGRFRMELVNIHPADGGQPTHEVEGMPIARETVVALRPNAKIRETRIAADGTARTIRRPRPALPQDVEQHIRRRDQHCRAPSCDAKRGLQIHHLNPRLAFGDTADPRELAAVCPHHHRWLEPHGPYRLVGDAEDPNGLRLVHRDDEPRAGPSP
jgi:hypothetical protein